jgi:hypothetical protein
MIVGVVLGSNAHADGTHHCATHRRPRQNSTGDKEGKVSRRAQSTIPAHEGVLSGEAEEAARISAKLFNPLVNFAGPQVARFTVSAHTCTILTSQRQYVNDDR